MTSYMVYLQQLPNALQNEISVHLGSTAGMSELQLVSRYRDVAWHLKTAKLASLPPSYQPFPGHLTVDEFNRMSGGGVDMTGVAAHFIEIHRQILAQAGAWYLESFLNQLLTIQTQLAEAARLQAQRQAEEAARQLAQRQAEEAARQLAQRQAEEAARLQAQRLAEEAARQLAQRQAEEAAQLAARQLAEQQAHAAAQVLAEQKAQEAALQEARLALELATAANTQPPGAAASNENASSATIQANSPAREIAFIPGPVAIVEIDRATLVLKQSIDAAVIQYVPAISPYLNTPETLAHATR